MLGLGAGNMQTKASLWRDEFTGPRPATATGGRYRILIRTAVGWSQSRDKFRSLAKARESALWFLSCSGVESVRILDTNGEPSIVEVLSHLRSKPR